MATIKLNMEFTNDNAAFEGVSNEGAVRDFLETIGLRIKRDGADNFFMHLIDINGNKVGTCSAEVIDDDDPS